MERNTSTIPIQPKLIEFGQTNCDYIISKLEKGTQNKAKPRLDSSVANKVADNSLHRTLTYLSNKDDDDVEKKDETTTTVLKKTIGIACISLDVTNASVATHSPSLSISDNNNNDPKDPQNKNASSQQSLHQKQHISTPSSSSYQPQDLTRKRTRQKSSSQTSHLKQPQNLSKKNIKSYSSIDIWKRYDLIAMEMITAHETVELEAVQKEIWKLKKFVPYNGINTTLV